MELRTERLLLRPFTPADVDDLLALDADPEVARWTGEPAPSREELETEWLPAFARMAADRPGLGFFTGVLPYEDVFVGWFHLRPRSGAADPELGYRLLSRFWGRGLATEGSRALVDHAFRSLPVERIVAETAGFHTASRRVMEKCGLRLVRSFPSAYPPLAPEDVLGDVEYAITREQWSAAQHR